MRTCDCATTGPEAAPRRRRPRHGLSTRRRTRGPATIYVNDNFGFVLEARHSIFFQTPLEYLLAQKEVDRIVLAGQVTEQCILYSALDAFVRHLDVAVPRDAVAHIHEELAEPALRMMEVNMGADVGTADECRLAG